MVDETRFGLPRLSVIAADGREIDLSAFQGHPLILACCPADECDVARFLKDLSAHMDRLVRLDAWVIGIVDRADATSGEKLRMLLATDPGGKLHTLLGKYVGQNDPRITAGGVFLFGRGGNLQRYWLGQPDAEDVVAELARRR